MFLSKSFSLPFLKFFAVSNRSQLLNTMTAVQAVSGAFPWCTLALQEHGSAVCRPLHDMEPNSTGALEDLDISTSAGWMEWIERTENRSHDSGGAGAYDTFRCDLQLDKSEDRWRIWGQDFHLRRLQESFRSIAPNASPESTQKALKLSEEMVQALLQQAEHSEILHNARPQADCDAHIQLVRLTILWSSPSEEDGSIIVRGHACSDTRPVSIHKPIEPIVATVAAKKQSHHQVNVDTSMPSRLRDPQHKIASWTRLRQKMERPYKPPGVAEVLMLLPSDGEGTHVLEGLTSNVFVLYSDGTLRTANEGVLYGYARHLVLECAEKCGLRWDPSLPILLEDAEKGLWKEAFITSSSRLIHPISKVMIPSGKENEFEDYWHDPVLMKSPKNGMKREPQKWQQLRDEILRRGGY